RRGRRRTRRGPRFGCGRAAGLRLGMRLTGREQTERDGQQSRAAEGPFATFTTDSESDHPLGLHTSANSKVEPLRAMKEA
ncbi:MAG: hypothetical protein JWN04_5864, partial [Myxococcaceae bacterium]|nr:hypothetical protein [Myxococcaceae bacterium]